MSKDCYMFNSVNEARAKIVQCSIAIVGSAIAAANYYHHGDQSQFKACVAVSLTGVCLLGIYSYEIINCIGNDEYNL